MSKRVCLVGTAETCQEAPFGDPTVEIWTLNDAYMLGFPRIDVHYEMHPLNRFVFRPRDQVKPPTVADIPPGHYLRPEGHLEWLGRHAQTKRLILQGDPLPGWPKAERYPREAMLERFKDVLFIDPTWTVPYAASGPIWMLMQAIAEGATEILVYGIHLATEQEYIDQRPNFECLIGYAVGQGVKVTLPPRTPICKSTHAYCYDVRRSQERNALRYRIQQVDAERASVTKTIKPWHRKAKDHLRLLGAQRHELTGELMRVEFQENLRRPEWRVA